MPQALCVEALVVAGFTITASERIFPIMAAGVLLEIFCACLDLLSNTKLPRPPHVGW